mmetsp:Transcript_15493/g.18671  ORF Transcript_15493/g.18671 Transcript_15493/m.18671 type:complete len:385 (-) Transcript_15493:295-1449(-)
MTTYANATYQNMTDVPSGRSSADAKIKISVLEKKDGGNFHAKDDVQTSFVYLPPNRTVAALKTAIRSQHGVPEQSQTAIYKGQVLHDNFVLGNVPGLCGEDGNTAHVRIVLRSDVEGSSKGPFDDPYGRSSPASTKASAPPPGYFRQQSIFRRHSQGSFHSEPAFQFPRDISEESDLVRKVYSALSLQMLATFAISFFFMFYQPANDFVMQNQGVVFYGSFFVSIGTLLALMCFKAKYPTNVYLLAAFTAAMSCQVGVICTMYANAGLGEVVLQATVYTAAIFGALTIYAFTTRIDVRSWGPYLFVGLIVLMLWGFGAMLFGFKTNWIYSLGGALLFSAYILYDTSRLLHTYGADENWVIFTIDLYLDIINLFLFILQLLSKRD